jgi:hypothetical protein
MPVHTSRGIHPASCRMGMGVLSRGVKRPERRGGYAPNLAPKLSMNIALLLLLSVPGLACYGVTFNFTMCLDIYLPVNWILAHPVNTSVVQLDVACVLYGLYCCLLTTVIPVFLLFGNYAKGLQIVQSRPEILY